MDFINSLDFKPMTKEHISFTREYNIKIAPIISEFQKRQDLTEKNCSDFIKKIKKLKQLYPYT